MNRREQIIVGLMVLVCLYGAYEFLLGNGKTPAGRRVQNQGADLKQFVSEVTEKMSLSEASPARGYVLATMRQPDRWAKDPFGDDLPPETLTIHADTDEAQPTVRQTSFAYTGYMAMGDRRMAIVNGSEYFEGESLAQSGYQLYRVTPGEIEVRSTDGDNRQIIPLTEDKAQ